MERKAASYLMDAFFSTRDMWSRKLSFSNGSERRTMKDYAFNLLYTECRLSPFVSRGTRAKLESFSKEDRKEIVSRMRDGCAPLFIACKKGNADIVDYILTTCGADVEQRGVYEVAEDRSMHFVTPLWCAAVAGNLAVVRCLVKHGANVNSASDTGSTPVRSACFMTHYEVVVCLVRNNANIETPNYNGGTCLINSVQSVPLCNFLIQCDANVNARDMQFKTALHYAIQEHRFEATKLLLENGADPYLKSKYGDDALQTACLKGAVDIFDYLKERYPYDPQTIADAHELMGSTFLDDDYNDMQRAFHHWKTALELRYDSTDTIQLPKLDIPLRPAYLNLSEFKTFEDLDNVSMSADLMRVHSLLICERILGPLHRDTIFRLMYRGASYADNFQYQRCIDLWCYALDLRIQKDGILHNEICFSIQSLVRLFIDLLDKNKLGVFNDRLRFKDVYLVIRLLANQLQKSMEFLQFRPIFKKQQENFDSILKVMMLLLFFLYCIEPKCPKDVFDMKALISELTRINPLTSVGDSLLHLVISKATSVETAPFLDDEQTENFPSLELAELLIECGADVDATNHNGSSPLHIASMSVNFRPEIVDLLLRNGAHIDRRNRSGSIPCMMLREISVANFNPLNHISLKCLAARKVIDFCIPYHGELPTQLIPFVAIH